MTTMKAAVYYGANDVRIEDRPVPLRGTGEVLLRVLRSGMCGTDATEWRAGPHLFPSNFIFGHEFIGEVVEADDGGRWAVGDLVASGAGVSCGHCVRCLEGRTNLCLTYSTLGLQIDGGMAEFVACPASVLVAIPEGLSLDLAGLSQPLAVGLHAARRANAVAGDRVVLIGAGAIGTFILAGLLSLEKLDVTVVDFAGPRLERAQRVGAARVVAVSDSTQDDVRQIVGDPGADIVIEASGAPGQFANALAMVRPGGTVLQVGIAAQPQPVEMRNLVLREVTVRTSLAHVCGEDLEPALHILATTSVGTELLDSVHPLDDITQQLDRLASGELEGKVLFAPGT